MDIREQRKLEHIKYSLEIDQGPLTNGFEDVRLIHQAIPNQNFEEIDTSLSLLGKKLRFPLIINAMTGGAEGLEKINKRLSFIAKEYEIGIAVGSQTAALNNKKLIDTYKIVRDTNPNGLILANVSALASPEEAQQAVEMLEADGLQLHLNVTQELAMHEGDRNFQGIMDNINNIKNRLWVPVIVKEVGYGLSREVGVKLAEIGIKYLDIGGTGGTNFAAIEQARNQNYTNSHLISWGIPTAISLLEVLDNKSIKSSSCEVIASGGIRSSLEIVKSLVIGAKAVAIALPFLKLVYYDEEKAVINYLENIIKETQELILLSGAGNLKQLTLCPILISGQVKEWLELRGIEITKYAQRSF